MRRVAGVVGVLWLVGCSGSPGPVAEVETPVDDPLAVVVDPNQSIAGRERAIDQAWSDMEAGKLTRDKVRGELKEIAWGAGFPIELRLRAIQVLMHDTDPEGLADMAQFAQLRLPTEPSLSVVDAICDAGVEHEWVELTPALVRSYSRAVDGVDDADRPERGALEALNPGTALTRVAFDVFLSPNVEDGSYGLNRRERTRADAWELLGRLDPDGSARLAMLTDQSASGDATVQNLLACVDDLSTLPITGEELVWLGRLAETRGDPQGWWATTSEVVRSLPAEARSGLRLRHLEPLRWASSHQSELLQQSREALLDELRALDAQREHHRRLSHNTWAGPTRDRLDEWADQLSWADIVTILVIDDAIREASVDEMLYAQADMDQRDDSTEYGGLLVTDSAGGFVARLYPPRPAQRQGDYQFVASNDMAQDGAFALSHYHFHAHKDRNAEFAGPSEQDLSYATRQGVTCLVLTNVARGVMGVDLYQPGGITVDLGEIRR